MHFAGVVDLASDGVVGPNWILVHEPGSVCKIRTTATVSTGIGGTKNTGAMMSFTVGINSVGAADTDNGRFGTGGFPGAGSAQLLAEGTASVPSDTYLKMAQLCEGPQSGGREEIAITTTLTGNTIIPAGYVVIDPTTAAAAGICSIAVPVGVYQGQKFCFEINGTTVNTVKVSLTGAIPGTTTTMSESDAQTACTAVTLDADNDYVYGEWVGTQWNVMTNARVS
jgi:hypothetical protein